jgi:hypothetical protein
MTDVEATLAASGVDWRKEGLGTKRSTEFVPALHFPKWEFLKNKFSESGGFSNPKK